MLILVTNDDGIAADGLRALVGELSNSSELVVVAPDQERSASGHGITLGSPLRASRHSLFDGVEAWSTSGTPADCVKLAIHELMDRRPDLVISGINFGLNTGTNVIYSGTVSAAREAAVLGIPAMAVSLEASPSPEFAVAARVTRRLVGWLRTLSDLPQLLNVNVPAVDMNEIDDVVITHNGQTRLIDFFEVRQDPRKRRYYWLAWEEVQHDERPTSDHQCVKDRKVSVTPLALDHTDYGAYDDMKTQGLPTELSKRRSNYEVI